MKHAQEIESINASDPLQVSVPLLHETVLYPYGYPVRLRTNSQALVVTANDHWSSWKQRFGREPLEVRYVVSRDQTAADLPVEPVLRAQRNLLMVSAGMHNFGCCDLSSGFASVWLTPQVAGNPDYLRFFFLDGIVYPLLSSAHFAFVHAACVEYEGCGVLLSGESGAGKSCLAYACARRGWTYISDDASVLWPYYTDHLVLGDCRRFRFRTSAADLFPEIRPLVRPSQRPTGKPTLEVRATSLGVRSAPEAHASCIVFLNRSTTPVAAAITPSSATSAVRKLYLDVWPPELGTRETQIAAIRRLTSRGVFELVYFDLDDAVDCLQDLVSRLK